MLDHIENSGVGSAAVVNEEAGVEIHHYNPALESSAPNKS
jgi:hypothetical protein